MQMHNIDWVFSNLGGAWSVELEVVGFFPQPRDFFTVFLFFFQHARLLHSLLANSCLGVDGVQILLRLTLLKISSTKAFHVLGLLFQGRDLLLIFVLSLELHLLQPPLSFLVLPALLSKSIRAILMAPPLAFTVYG